MILKLLVLVSIVHASSASTLKRAHSIEVHSIRIAESIRNQSPSFNRPILSLPILDLVKDCGGDSSGKINNNIAINTCLSKLSSLGEGGTLFIPSGKFLTSPFNITSANNQLTLLLDPSATLVATTDVSKWPIIQPLPSLNSSREYLIYSRYSAFITILGAEGIRITSNVTEKGKQGGIIDGNGQFWWNLRENKELTMDPGAIIETYESINIEIDSVSVIFSPYWHIHPYSSSFIYIHDTVVSSLHSGPETDGIDPDCSHDVLLERLSIDTGDDAISCKSGWDLPGILYAHPTYNVVLINSTLSTGANAFCMGSEMSGGIYNVTAHNVSCVDVDSCFRLKSSLGRGGVISDVYMFNSSALGAKTAIEASDYYGGHPGLVNQSLIPVVGNAGVIGFKGVFTESSGNFQGLPNSNINNFLMVDVNLDSQSGSWSCVNVTGTATNVKPKPCSNFIINDDVVPISSHFAPLNDDVVPISSHFAPLPCGSPTILGFYTPECDTNGLLLPPPGGVQQAIDLSVNYYALSPRDLPLSHGFPPFVWSTFTSGDYIPTSLDIIAGMQDGMGLIGYLKLFTRAKAGRGGNATAALDAAIYLGDYLSIWSLTPSIGVWSNVTRSTGVNIEWPLFSSSQGDAAFGINCIETDRVGMTGYALLKLYEVVPTPRYLAQAIHSARVLASTQTDGNATEAPWPFRVDAVTGEFLNGRKNGESAFPLRLFRALSASPYSMSEFEQPAMRLWAWIRDFQLPTARSNITPTEALFVNFFEDRTTTLDNNRNSWTALELARYLIEERESLDINWKEHVEDIFSYSLSLFGHPSNIGNATIMGEQDDDNKPWGGANSKLGGVASKYGCAIGSAYYAKLGKLNAYHMSYFTDPTDGCRSANAYEINIAPTRGGWTEDAWLDVLHNLVDHLEAVDGFC